MNYIVDFSLLFDIIKILFLYKLNKKKYNLKTGNINDGIKKDMVSNILKKSNVIMRLVVVVQI